MQARHVPRIDARYWAGITLASIFGTNLGDLYAHESGLGLIGGVPILVALFAVIYVLERRDTVQREAYYWLCIIVMRTGATNIADYLAFRMHINMIGLSVALAIAIAVFGYAAARLAKEPAHSAAKDLPDTNGFYWAAMLSAGVFGTVLGDVCTHWLGGEIASLGLGALLAAVLFWGRSGAAKTLTGYWLTIAIARTAGTAVGDWLAENEILRIGLPLATLMTGIAFAAVLIAWRSGGVKAQAPAA